MWTSTPPTPAAVLKAGDSITLGQGSTSGDGWRAQVMASVVLPLGYGLIPLGSSATTGGGASGWQDYMTGGSGRETPAILTALQTDAPKFLPKIVTIFAGTNDSNHRVSGFGTPPTLAETVANLSLMIDACAAVGSRVVFVCPLPPNVDPVYDAAIQVQDTAVLAMINAHAYQGKVTRVDARAAILSVPSWQVAAMSDDTHPNDTGYAALATVISAGVVAAL